MDNREKQAAFKARMREKGYVLVADWIPADQREAFKRFAKELREQHAVTSTGMVTSEESVTSNTPTVDPPITVPVQPIVATVTDQRSNIETQAEREARECQARLAHIIEREAKREAARKRDLPSPRMPDPMPMMTPPPHLMHDEGDDLVMSAIAREFRLPEHLTPQQIEAHVNALPQTKANLVKINRAMRTLGKRVMEDRKRRDFEKAGGYAVLRGPSIL